jgi:iron complex outermembrane receptor protein
VPVVPPQALPPPVVRTRRSIPSRLYFVTDPRKTGETYLASLAFADTISAFDERIQLIGGLRSQRVMTKTFQANTGIETNSYDSHRLSPAFALIVKPFDNRLSLYANYIEGLSQGYESPIRSQLISTSRFRPSSPSRSKPARSLIWAFSRIPELL